MTFDPRLYYVHDYGFRPYAETLHAALRGGVKMVQLRAKDITRDEFRAWAAPLVSLCRRYSATVLINDDVALALELNADGVHLGQSDLPVRDARRMLGNEAIIGLSLESVGQIDDPAVGEADYIAASGVFPTPTKTDLPSDLGLQGVRELRARTEKPLIAIGGIHAGNARAVFSAGADGVALISAIAGAEDPQLATAELAQLARRAAEECAILSHAKLPRPGMAWRDPRALTIAGSDSGGGAGIQADLKTMTALGVFGTSALTALTAQNTMGVQSVYEVSTEFLRAQMISVMSDIGADAIKIGMLHRRDVIHTIRSTLCEFPPVPVILDPVMVAKGGHRLIEDDAISALIEILLPQVSLVTPNLHEAEALLTSSGRKAKALTLASREELRDAALRLLELGPQAVLLKGGHHASTMATDLLVTREGQELWFESVRIDTPNLHGTGCSLSSAIAAFTARGYPLYAAVAKAKDYVAEGIKSGARFRWGQGQGPIDHIHLHR